MIDAILAFIALHLGLSQTASIAIITLTVGVANLVGKAIPDEATGVLGFIRKVAKVIGLYVPNRTAAAK